MTMDAIGSDLPPGYSDHSPFKQEVLQRFLVEHVAICREIGKRWHQWEYLYIDMYSGPGYLLNYHDIPGSPVIAMRTCQGIVPFRGIAFDVEESNCKKLAERTQGQFTIHCGRSEEAMERIARTLVPARRLGLVYADPCSLSPANTELLDALRAFSMVPSVQYIDILLHVPATTYKRVRGVNLKKNIQQPRLDEALKRINKKIIKVSRPDDRHQWTFILFTNYEHPQFASRVGWHSINSDKGGLRLDRISRTQAEQDLRPPNGFLFNTE
jgi:three-Cys-motif partner protein